MNTIFENIGMVTVAFKFLGYISLISYFAFVGLSSYLLAQPSSK